jgi:hypothetical protein
MVMQNNQVQNTNIKEANVLKPVNIPVNTEYAYSISIISIISLFVAIGIAMFILKNYNHSILKHL